MRVLLALVAVLAVVAHADENVWTDLPEGALPVVYNEHQPVAAPDLHLDMDEPDIEWLESEPQTADEMTTEMELPQVDGQDVAAGTTPAVMLEEFDELMSSGADDDEDQLIADATADDEDAGDNEAPKEAEGKAASAASAASTDAPMNVVPPKAEYKYTDKTGGSPCVTWAEDPAAKPIPARTPKHLLQKQVHDAKAKGSKCPAAGGEKKAYMMKIKVEPKNAEGGTSVSASSSASESAASSGGAAASSASAPASSASASAGGQAQASASASGPGGSASASGSAASASAASGSASGASSGSASEAKKSSSAEKPIQITINVKKN